MADLFALLTRLCQASGVSGGEDQIRSLVARELGKLTDEVQITRLGSVIGIKRAKRPRGLRASLGPRLLIEAHMDQIGLVVTDIQEGFIRFQVVGSWDPRVLPAQNVIVHGRKPLRGIIGARPPHVLSQAERQKPIPLQSLFIDVGLSDARVRELVAIGDMITLEPRVTRLRNNLVVGQALDDRAGIAVLLEFLKQMQEMDHVWDLYAVANVSEEASALYVGAATSTAQIRPQLALALDVTYATQPGVADANVGALGQGPCIARGAHIHPFVHRRLVQTAQRAGIPYRVTVYGGDTKTDAGMMQVTAAGVPTGLVELPLRYMHTSVEMVHLEDLARAAELLRAFALSLDRADAEALPGETYTRASKSGAMRRARLHPSRLRAKPARR